MTVSMTTIQQVTLTAAERDARGNAVTPAEPLSWAADNPDLVMIEVSGDSMSCVVRALSAGDVTVTVTDPASGLAAAAQVAITASPAVSMDVSAGAPEDDPAVPAA